ncbi:MAG: HAD-IA family hydrolase [Thermoanaerobaculales bacterium]|jgi:putative hydrolase of the HAD superfamily|nr:HAD-IA family hydrolase [Thermoanaerobaculales bacterium]
MTGFRALTFDVGNTLLRCDPPPAEIYAAALGRHGRPVTAAEVEPVFAAAWTELQTRTPPGVDRYGALPGGERMWWGAFLREVLARLDHEADWRPLLDDLWAAFARPEVWRLYPEVRPTLEAARRRGLRLGVISNWDRRLPEILGHLGLTGCFDTITVSAIEGLEKPAPAIFERTLARLGVAARQAVHIGDSPLEDYRGAEGVGMTALLVDRSEDFACDGYRTVSRLDQALELL